MSENPFLKYDDKVNILILGILAIEINPAFIILGLYGCMYCASWILIHLSKSQLCFIIIDVNKLILAMIFKNCDG